MGSLSFERNLNSMGPVSKLRTDGERAVGDSESSHQSREETTSFRAESRDARRGIEAKNLLFQIVVSICRRFLEQAKAGSAKSRLDPPDYEKIRKGNDAAHQGNGEADATVFTTEAVFEDDNLRAIYKELYQMEPTKFLLRHPPKMQRAVNLDARSRLSSMAQAWRYSVPKPRRAFPIFIDLETLTPSVRAELLIRN